MKQHSEGGTSTGHLLTTRIGASGVGHLDWALQNPLQNFRAFVIGVQDRNYEVEVVYGNPDPQVVQRNNVGEYGYQVIKLKFKCGVPLPFVSYSGKRVVWYAGWQPSGFLVSGSTCTAKEN